jgi:hypothetical protein
MQISAPGVLLIRSGCDRGANLLLRAPSTRNFPEGVTNDPTFTLCERSTHTAGPYGEVAEWLKALAC